MCVQAVNAALTLSGSVFFIPVVINVCAIFSCSSAFWLNTQMACLSGSHVAVALIAAVVLVLFVALLAFGTDCKLKEPHFLFKLLCLTTAC